MPSLRVVVVKPDPEDDGVGTAGGMGEWGKPQNSLPSFSD